MSEWTRWVPGSLMALGYLFVLAGNRQREMPLPRPLATMPSKLAGYSGTDLQISEGEQRAAGMSAYLLRAFAKDTVTAFTVYVGYYDHQRQGKTIHSPKNCLPGAGWEALQSSQVVVDAPAGPETVNRYLLQSKTARALVLYWYQGRGRVAANEYRVKWELLRDAAIQGRTEEALVRIVVFLDSGMDAHHAEDLARTVAAELIPAVQKALPA